MTTPDAAIFEMLTRLTPEEERQAIDAVNEFTIGLMYHKFTKRPRRGLMQRIMPPLVCLPAAEIRRLGLTPAGPVEINGMPGMVCSVVEDNGDLFYEVAEERLDREDYQARYAARRVPRYEWVFRYRHERLTDRRRASRKREDFFYGVMGEIVADVVDIAASMPFQRIGMSIGHTAALARVDFS